MPTQYPRIAVVIAFGMMRPNAVSPSEEIAIPICSKLPKKDP